MLDQPFRSGAASRQEGLSWIVFKWKANKVRRQDLHLLSEATLLPPSETKTGHSSLPLAQSNHGDMLSRY